MARSTAKILIDLQSRDTKRREASVRQICDMIPEADDEIIETLEELASKDPSINIRYYIRRCLASRHRDGTSSASIKRIRIPDPLTLDIAERMLGSGDRTQQLAVLIELDRREDVSFADLLVSHLGKERNPWVLARIVATLRRIGQPHHAPTIRNLLRHEDIRVCANSIETLVAISGEQVVLSLLPLLVREDNRVQANLMVALYHSFEHQVTGFVRRMLRSEKIAIRASGLFCARHTDPADVEPEVFDLLGQEQDIEVIESGVTWITDLVKPELAISKLEELKISRPDHAKVFESGIQKLRRIASEPDDPSASRAISPDREVGNSMGPRFTGESPSGSPMAAGAADMAGEMDPETPGRPLRATEILSRLTPLIEIFRATVAGLIETLLSGSRWLPGKFRTDRRLQFALASLLLIPIGFALWPSETAKPYRPASRPTRSTSSSFRNDIKVLVTEVSPDGTDLAVSIMGSIYPLKLALPPDAPIEKGSTLVLSGARLVRAEDGIRRIQVDSAQSFR